MEVFLHILFIVEFIIVFCLIVSFVGVLQDPQIDELVTFEGTRELFIFQLDYVGCYRSANTGEEM